MNATIDMHANLVIETPDNIAVEFIATDSGRVAAYDINKLTANDCQLDLFKAIYRHAINDFSNGPPMISFRSRSANSKNAWPCLNRATA
jgi:hypothetical protein